MRLNLGRFGVLRRLTVLGCAAAMACSGRIGSDAPGAGAVAPGEGQVPGNAVPPAGDTGSLVAHSGARRLTPVEYNNSLHALLYDDTRPALGVLPEGGRHPFDNDYAEQAASQALIEAAESLADAAVARLLSDPERRDRVVDCGAEGPTGACLERFVSTFGRRAFRRPLADSEVQRFVAAASAAKDGAAEVDDAYAGVAVVLRAMLQSVNFLYRIEVGKPVASLAGVYQLNDWETATRLAYLLWGAPPDDALLDQAEAGALRLPEQRRDAAMRLLDDSRALARVERFHTLWLGFEELSGDTGRVAAMRGETRALLRRVIFEERRPWADLLRSDETFIDDQLAELYGMPLSGDGEATWRRHTDDGRRGILAHASFLSVGRSGDDSSPIHRGIAVRTRLLCQDVPPPPPDLVLPDLTEASPETPCKQDRFRQHATPECKACHDQIDPIGFGLENYDLLGRYRSHDDGQPDCTIDGQGELAGIGKFSGPAELGRLLAEDEAAAVCRVTQFYRHASGRMNLDRIDRRAVEALVEQIPGGQSLAEASFDQLLLAYVGSEPFGYRREEQPQP